MAFPKPPESHGRIASRGLGVTKHETRNTKHGFFPKPPESHGRIASRGFGVTNHETRNTAFFRITAFNACGASQREFRGFHEKLKTKN